MTIELYRTAFYALSLKCILKYYAVSIDTLALLVPNDETLLPS
jgi:hypothetical protein